MQLFCLLKQNAALPLFIKAIIHLNSQGFGVFPGFPLSQWSLSKTHKAPPVRRVSRLLLREHNSQQSQHALPLGSCTHQLGKTLRNKESLTQVTLGEKSFCCVNQASGIALCVRAVQWISYSTLTSVQHIMNVRVIHPACAAHILSFSLAVTLLVFSLRTMASGFARLVWLMPVNSRISNMSVNLMLHHLRKSIIVSPSI